MFLHSTDKLLTPIEYLKGVGPLKGVILRKEIGVNIFNDLLHYFPFRYMDRTSFVKIKDIPEEGDTVQLIGKITYYENRGEGKGRRLVGTFKDGTGSIDLVWFQGIIGIERILENGGNFIVYGKASRFNGIWNITHPEMDLIESADLEKFPSFQPVYSSTEKLKAKFLSGRNFVKLVMQLFNILHPNDLIEMLPDEVLKKYFLIGRWNALKNIHFPESEHKLKQAIHRLKFEELFLHQINICKLKLNNKKIKGYLFEIVGENFNTFYQKYLPFELTNDQKKVLKEIRYDTQRGIQMNRLLQGDVGSGKTIVALLSMLLAIDNDFQTCLMAPTEILANQHYEGICALLKDMPIKVAYLSGKTKAKDKKILLKQLLHGEINILIGTHALIEDKVVFKNLGLSIIDEQHRFGVAQRAKLYDKNILPPHVLVMTATPIPRTLAMTSYGDLEVSVIKELPPGRKPISTVHRSETYRVKVMEFIKHEISQGRQIYIVYPLIDESETLDYENLYAGYEQVKQFFPAHSYNIAMVHGKQTQQEREENMQSFVQGNAHILVATTVIEVGVNVPNASVMIIESAERFGLSQMHQLRGRVGRGADKSYCILLTGHKLSANGKERIKTMVTETSGFAISEKDLELRGAGEIDGVRQSGITELKIADIVKDVELMATTRQAAIDILQKDKELESLEYLKLKTYLSSMKGNEVWSRIS